MKVDDEVMTTDGPGVIKMLDFYKYARRYGVILDGGYTVIYYFENELTRREKN